MQSQVIITFYPITTPSCSLDNYPRGVLLCFEWQKLTDRRLYQYLSSQTAHLIKRQHTKALTTYTQACHKPQTH